MKISNIIRVCTGRINMLEFLIFKISMELNLPLCQANFAGITL